MIYIKHNSERYEIILESREFVWELGRADYDTPISEHVQTIIEVLAACNIEHCVEVL